MKLDGFPIPVVGEIENFSVESNPFRVWKGDIPYSWDLDRF
jgi:hypothetical protein